MIERRKWLRTLRKQNERQEDLLAPVFDERWGEVDDLHRTYVEAFLWRVPGKGTVLDAACGTGKYFQMVLEAGRTLLGVDHSGGHLDRAREKFPNVPTEKHDLQELPYREEFDGVMCIDAMEIRLPKPERRSTDFNSCSVAGVNHLAWRAPMDRRGETRLYLKDSRGTELRPVSATEAREG